MRLAAITVGVLLAPALGVAQARAQAAPAASEAQRLLQGAADPGDFTDLSSGGLIALKHRPSGLVCQFGPDPQGNSLRASPAGVICQTAGASEIDTMEAFHTAPSSEADVEEAVARALGQFGGGQPVGGFTDAKSDRPNAPAHVSRRYAATTGDGQQLFVRVAYSQVAGWFVLQRVISTPGAARLADGDGERRLLTAIGQVMDAQGQGGGR